MTERPAPPRRDPIDRVPILILFPHERCNCRCLMCDIWKATGRNQLSPEEVRSWSAEWRRLGVRRVVLSGGEPLMHPGFVALCEALRRGGPPDRPSCRPASSSSRGRRTWRGSSTTSSSASTARGRSTTRSAACRAPSTGSPTASGRSGPPLPPSRSRRAAPCSARTPATCARRSRPRASSGSTGSASSPPTSRRARSGGARRGPEARGRRSRSAPRTSPSSPRSSTPSSATAPRSSRAASSPRSAERLRARILAHFAAHAGRGDFAPITCNAPWVSRRHREPTGPCGPASSTRRSGTSGRRGASRPS